jgi:hypothetical protein
LIAILHRSERFAIKQQISNELLDDLTINHVEALCFVKILAVVVASGCTNDRIATASGLTSLMTTFV